MCHFLEKFHIRITQNILTRANVIKWNHVPLLSCIKRRKASIYTKQIQHLQICSLRIKCTIFLLILLSCTHLSLAVAWCSPHGCRLLGYLAH